MKERLTGAIILVALIVVLVPELLSGPIRPAARTRGPAPSAEEPPLRSYTISLADEPHGGSGSPEMQPASVPSPPAPAAEPAGAARTAETATATAAPAVHTESAATPAEPLTTPTAPAPASAPSAPTPHAAAAPAPASPAGGTGGTGGSGYVVQLGSFASRSNADRLAHQVHGLGYPVSVSRGSSGRRLYRVLVGPARDRAAAEQMAAKLRAQGHAGTVVPK